MALFDRDGAVGEVARGYELVKHLQALHGRDVEAPELAQSLLREALQALNVALSIMRPVPAITAEQRELAADQSGSPARCGGGRAVVQSEDWDSRDGSVRRGKRQRREDRSWTSITAVPHDDGFLWRKYGEKRISGSEFTRSYFRCTYKDDQGCGATKQIQQKNYTNPPMFQVTYNNEHTCKPTTGPNTAFQTTFDPNFASHHIIKQEPHLPSSCINISSDYEWHKNNLSTSINDHLTSVLFQSEEEQMVRPHLPSSCINISSDHGRHYSTPSNNADEHLISVSCESEEEQMMMELLRFDVSDLHLLFME